MFIKCFSELSIGDVSIVGGKNASLGEMFSKLFATGIQVPDGFATTAEAFRSFIQENNIESSLRATLDELDTSTFSNLQDVGRKARALIMSATLSQELKTEILSAYENLCSRNGRVVDVAVRSSATAEDLPNASFAGQHESYLNISGGDQLLEFCHKCYASLFTDRAIKYRHVNGFDHMQVALSVGVQMMVRSDVGSAGVAFTIDPDSGLNKVILITGIWGLGENIVQGAVTPDEYYIFKPSVSTGKRSLISKKLGAKELTMVYGNTNGLEQATINNDTPPEKREQFVLTDQEAELLGQWCQQIETHYNAPMDIEWAKDGITGDIYIVQARPETVHARANVLQTKEYTLLGKGKVLTTGKGIGNRIISGVARLLESPADSHLLKEGEVLITEITNPDWDPILKKAAAIVTNRGGRTSHAAIVARELGALAVVGAGNATEVIKDGDLVTVVCEDGVNGVIYEGKLEWKEEVTDLSNLELPDTDVMFILGDPDKAFRLAQLPNNGVGLMRLEFIINNSIQIHPMALVHFDKLSDQDVKEQIDSITHHFPDKKEYFVENLAQAVATIAGAFWPKDVIVRMSDFKTNEYANLVGGKEFEPEEENPMLGFRGASRYYSDRYKEGFGLECLAMKRVRDEMGLTNVKLMIPFCRTLDEGKKVLQIMDSYGLKRGENGLEIYVMVEIPSNVILAHEFAGIFDGFSIGSNDLTQLTLGIDRDSSTVSQLFNENDPAPLKMISMAIRAANETGTKIGLCGQAPSDFPEFAAFLVKEGINSISFNPDALVQGIKNMKLAEEKFLQKSGV